MEKESRVKRHVTDDVIVPKSEQLQVLLTVAHRALLGE